MRRSRVKNEKYKIPVFVGGARKTCVVKPEGFSKSARELAKFYLKERRERFVAALKSRRYGYLFLTGRRYVTFVLVDDEEHLTANILVAMKSFANEVDTTPCPPVLPPGIAQLLACQ